MKSNFEVKINKEIRDYTESILLGLSLRQSIFSILACGSACIIYFLCSDKLGQELTSWLCMLGVLPFACFWLYSIPGNVYGGNNINCLLFLIAEQLAID